MRLSPGTPAPHFRTDDVRGDNVDMAAFRGSIVWLGFFRYALCPLCNLRVHQMLGFWRKRYEPRCRFVAIFQSPRERFTEFMQRHNPPFAVVADPALDLYGRYGVESGLTAALRANVIGKTVEAARAGFSLGALTAKDGGALRIPADFIVDRDGLIRTARYGVDVADSIPFADADAALDAVGAPPAR